LWGYSRRARLVFPAAGCIRGAVAVDSRSDAEGGIVVKLVVRDRESIQEAVRRFRKLVERSGIKKEMRRREFYEKPSALKRRARLRAERRARRNSLLGT
jgi:small subunit ribosomal protein S21